MDKVPPRDREVVDKVKNTGVHQAEIPQAITGDREEFTKKLDAATADAEKTAPVATEPVRQPEPESEKAPERPNSGDTPAADVSRDPLQQKNDAIVEKWISGQFGDEGPNSMRAHKWNSWAIKNHPAMNKRQRKYFIFKMAKARGSDPEQAAVEALGQTGPTGP